MSRPARRFPLTLSIALALGTTTAAHAELNSDLQGNTRIGTEALLNVAGGVANSAFGANTLDALTIGNQNVAFGAAALGDLVSGSANSAFGVSALRRATGGELSAFGFAALQSNTSGTRNNAFGYLALNANEIGARNNAFGSEALRLNTADDNTAFGDAALEVNVSGTRNSAFGADALAANTGDNNSAFGYQALHGNTTGANNAAFGNSALASNTTGQRNVAVGAGALSANTTGSDNTALGNNAGSAVTTGTGNVHIANRGAATDTRVIRIGRQGTQRSTFIAGIRGTTVTGGAAVVVNKFGQLGVQTSSQRFKTAVQPMADDSSALLALEPVTFRYKEADENGEHPLQFGLIAEDVAKVMPELVVYDEQGKPETVAYQEMSSLLLNELKKERALRQQETAKLTGEVAALLRAVDELRAETARLAAGQAGNGSVAAR